MIGLVAVRIGEAGYEELLGPVRRDRALLDRMWQEAESRLGETGVGTLWCVATAAVAGTRVATAWIAIDDAGDTLLLHDHYERPEYRGRGIYARLVGQVHADHMAAGDRPAVTYVFETPMLALSELGWTATGEGDSDEPDVPSHHWWRMEWQPRG